ncbi:hypothetical protein JCGZ_03280 [Jatropha curcas]|uniref:Aminotransferase-like plant mobile domain-containing protein n=1 Tax=Jatropha curcas TaxID=180498 RepID=A0A067JDM8_JATCU|nr:hypothetical protein JCGZ_03280 [Jatropha curcas]
MRYALMEQWNDCTHTFVFGFGEMTLTPVDYAAITSLRFTGPVPLLDAQYQTAAIGAQLFRSLLGVTTQTRYTVQGYMSYETVWSYEYCIFPGGLSGDSPIESRRIPRYLAHCHHTYASGEDPEYWRSFLNDRDLSDLSLEPWDCEAWRTYPGREDCMLGRGYWADRYFLGERVFDTPIAPTRRRVPHAPPQHMCLLEGLTREDLEVEYRGFSANDFLSASDFPAYFASQMQARLPEVLEYTHTCGKLLLQYSWTLSTHTCAGSKISGDLSAVRLCPVLYRSALL